MSVVFVPASEWQTTDEWRAAQVSTGEVPTYFTPAREQAIREWGAKAGLRNEPLPHEPQVGE